MFLLMNLVIEHYTFLEFWLNCFRLNNFPSVRLQSPHLYCVVQISKGLVLNGLKYVEDFHFSVFALQKLLQIAASLRDFENQKNQPAGSVQTLNCLAFVSHLNFELLR